jgi:hypothetical protein
MADEKKNSGWKNTVLNIAVFLGLIGTIFGMNKYFVLKEVYDAKCEASSKEFKTFKIEVAQTFQGMQNQITVQRAYDEVYFWQKTVIQLSQALAQNPNNGMLKVQLNNARTRLQEAENKLRKLQGR